MARILILHALLGDGHRRAAEALAVALDGTAQVLVEDALDYIHPLARRLWTTGYRRLSEQAPALYKAFYRASDAGDLQTGMSSTLRAGRLSRRYLARIDWLVASYRPDAVVCTMQFPLQLMSHMRHTRVLRAPLYVVVTDYVPHGSWVAAEVERYFVPSEQTAAGFARKGVARRQLCVTGVPVDPELARPKSRAEARLRLGLPQNRPVLVLFGGGIKPGHLRQIAAGLLAGPLPATLVTVSGRNERMAVALAGLQPGPEVDLVQYGAVAFVDDLVAASDLVITKAGGLITSEVLARGRAMLLTGSLPGQEEWNADFVCGVGAGVQIHTPAVVAATAFELLAWPERLAQMEAQARRVGWPQAAHKVAARILADLDQGRREAAA